MGRQRRKGENENIKKRKQTAGMKIGVGEGDWKDLSNFKKLGAIYTKEVLWTFYHSAHQQSIKQLLFFFFSFFLTAKLLILSECAEIKVFLSVLMSPIQYHCLHFRQEHPGFITVN